MTDQTHSVPFLGLLASFIAVFILIPLVDYAGQGGVLIDLGFTLTVIFSVYVVAERRLTFMLAAILALPGIAINWSGWFEHSIVAQNLKLVFSLALSAYVAFVLIGYILKSRKVDANIIYGSVCIYLLLGMTWVSAYTLVEFNAPGALQGIAALPEGLTAAQTISVYSESFFYYSYITLTTLGYGNISPASPAANALSSAEAIVGQLYIAILIARLVGLYVAQR